MKAAVMYQKEGLPQYTDFPEPIAQHDDEVLVTVKAVAIKHLDKSRASGKHYSSDAPKESGKVIGGDGVCVLEDGTRVYGMGVSGMLAEKATIDKDRIVKIPDRLDDATAAALPNAVIGAAMGLKFKADIQPEDVVLINGATGFTGRVAVQIAKHYGAKKVIVTGRNQASLDDLLSLGADEIVSVLQDDEGFQTQLAAIHAATPVDVIIDYLWGHTAEMILACVKGNGSFTNRVRYVSIGAMTGDLIQLSAANLRSVDLQLTGSGLGAWSKPQVGQLFSQILPEMFELAAAGKLKVETITVKLENIAELWDLEVDSGKRLVVII
ncbi:NADPH:quinone reductase [Mucilaginibacter lappiensis]|uniref:NADPH:quinone reductase-like Zn-dependent oxidoreductase n=1 Tax=Mucilaginibacter lappiensis TaxID=354630 RepID=A0ABR6PGR9_9SPHI|nr:zinc-binding alcohol dehydrogenase family protein [Mucilaginibacter lappiensis]MBB6108808.1 NADPH:quinone reductase-like Zn-dependent oxidoreductase [Mucilaginibacter lappiensis]SIQ63065.1 NADPH:quinone reductase [Mucilaginibacter lappiensis]